MAKMRAKMRIKMKFENRPSKGALQAEALTKKNGDGRPIVVEMNASPTTQTEDTGQVGDDQRPGGPGVPMPPDRMLTIDELGARLRLRPKAIRRLIDQGFLRFSWQALVRDMREHELQERKQVILDEVARLVDAVVK
jgi:hypothetical protein